MLLRLFTRERGGRNDIRANTWFNPPVDSVKIRELLTPYIVGLDLPSQIYDQLNTYLDLLLRWNAKINLTAIRDPEQIVTRHFGESLFTAKVLIEHCSLNPLGATIESGHPQTPGALFKPEGLSGIPYTPSAISTLADLGSGAGFPGLPIKLAIPNLHVTLIESQNKKATFLKEVIRALTLEGIEVYNGRAEHWGKQVDIVTMRAVEKFEAALPVARKLLTLNGRLCILVGGNLTAAFEKISGLEVEVEYSMPLSAETKVWWAR
jgi:16S rRNA (guanine527-N7)-methyltransferase